MLHANTIYIVLNFIHTFYKIQSIDLLINYYQLERQNFYFTIIVIGVSH